MKAAIIGLLICCCAAYLSVTEANYGCPIPTLCRLHCLRKLCLIGRCGGRGWIKRKCKCHICKRSNKDKANEEFPADESNEEFPADEFTEEFPIDDIN
ncbi:Hypothetical predicted protein [Mytilus galloprovincialis]|uniref:Myticin C n=1 Tax=Mytilus galloprovincialis TaxID=29158 RepID=A0A8B6CVW0_MYTGA|nr:Hypothetical predicted protein [Mytilus galloprovincialis]